MKIYENIFIANPNINPDELEKHVQKVSSLIQDNGGEIINLERWGLRHLAYKVKKFAKGHYVFFKIKADEKILNEIQQYYRISDTIIKFLIVKEKIYKIKTKNPEKRIQQPAKIEVGSDSYYATE